VLPRTRLGRFSLILSWPRSHHSFLGTFSPAILTCAAPREQDERRRARLAKSADQADQRRAGPRSRDNGRSGVNLRRHDSTANAGEARASGAVSLAESARQEGVSRTSGRLCPRSRAVHRRRLGCDSCTDLNWFRQRPKSPSAFLRRVRQALSEPLRRPDGRDQQRQKGYVLGPSQGTALTL
jgi:hypothetical protein